MYKYLFAILTMAISFPTISAEYEQKVIAGCASKAGGEPTATAICTGKVLTTTEINKCLKGSCLGENNDLKLAFESLYWRKSTKQSCGNFEIYTKEGASTEFSTGKEWKLCSGYKVSFQKDGNLVVYNRNNKAVWSSGTNNKGADQLSLQPNGNLVIYKRQYPIWSSSTHGNPGSFLALQEDGNFVIYNKYRKPIWATGTHGK